MCCVCVVLCVCCVLCAVWRVMCAGAPWVLLTVYRAKCEHQRVHLAFSPRSDSWPVSCVVHCSLLTVYRATSVPCTPCCGLCIVVCTAHCTVQRVCIQRIHFACCLQCAVCSAVHIWYTDCLQCAVCCVRSTVHTDGTLTASTQVANGYGAVTEYYGIRFGAAPDYELLRCDSSRETDAVGIR
jgi:hypothetical protein